MPSQLLCVQEVQHWCYHCEFVWDAGEIFLHWWHTCPVGIHGFLVTTLWLTILTCSLVRPSSLKDSWSRKIHSGSHWNLWFVCSSKKVFTPFVCRLKLFDNKLLSTTGRNHQETRLVNHCRSQSICSLYFLKQQTHEITNSVCLIALVVVETVMHRNFCVWTTREWKYVLLIDSCSRY